MGETPPPAVEALDVFKIHKEGAVETVALRGANVTLAPGEYASLAGPSGSGKSTLLSLVAGLSTPSAGKVIVNGRDVGALSEEERAELRATTIAVVFQAGNLIPFLSVEENVTLVAGRAGNRRAAKAQAAELLGELGLAARSRQRPGQLSGGEAQRAALAVALGAQPQLLLGDEITGELDSTTATVVMDVLERVAKERAITLLVVTHNHEVASRADRQLVMADGTVQDR
jgi:ABC-type lipoprotein export system ATPase subunit